MDFDEWIRRRITRSWPFPDFEEFIREMEEEFQKSFKDIEEKVPRQMVREKRLPDGSVKREFGPFIYGYSMTLGPDGKPVIREFGNVRPGGFGPQGRGFELTGKREPLVDVIDEGETVKVIAELPGVEKEDVRLEALEDTLIVSAERNDRRYYKEVRLPSPVEPTSAKSTFNNGILEVTLKKPAGRRAGYRIKVE
jgi:HSP20 family protein